LQRVIHFERNILEIFHVFLGPRVLINIIPVVLEDHGGATAFDVWVIGNTNLEFTTMLLLVFGLIGLAELRRKIKK